ncbi:uridine phosphorylase 2-like [Planococcus citri]|uniref:uridine phosphorylase 2-like n=1 Tax=Planococcus citri TaxID=170843 RepID=UPI0031F7AC62
MEKPQIGEEMQQKQQNGELVDNIRIERSKEDVLIHLELANKKDDLETLFKDVKFVCMGGTADRMKNFFSLIKSEMKRTLSELDIQDESVDFTRNGCRFSMWKIGCVLCVNHGIGYGSLTIVLHEVIKLLHYAKVQDPILFRIGTSGGVDHPLGTVVIAEKAFNDFFEEFFEIPVLGKRVRLPAILDGNLAAELKRLAIEKCPDIPVLCGNTMSHEHFYESVASVKASICYCDDDIERSSYFDSLRQNNILNADMEAVAIAAITNRLGIKAAVVNVIVNDLSHPTENLSCEILTEWQTRPQRIVAEYIKEHLRGSVKQHIK